MKAELSHGQKALLCLGVSCVSTPKSSHGGKRRPGPETRWQACQLSPHRGPGCPSLEMCAATVNQASLVSKTAGVTCSHQTLPPQHPGDHAWEGWRCERHHSLSPTLTATQITTLGITQSTTITAHLQVALSAEEGRPHGHPPQVLPPLAGTWGGLPTGQSLQSQRWNLQEQGVESMGLCQSHPRHTQDMFTCLCHLLPSLHISHCVMISSFKFLSAFQT